MKLLILLSALSLNSVAQDSSQEKMDWNTWQHHQAELEKQFNQLSTEIKEKSSSEKNLSLIGAAQEVHLNLKNRILAFQDKINALETDCQDPKKKIPHPMSSLKFIQISNGIKSEKIPDKKALDLIAVSRTIQEKQVLYMKDQRDRIDDLSAGCAQLSQMGAGKVPVKKSEKTKTKSKPKAK